MVQYYKLIDCETAVFIVKYHDIVLFKNTLEFTVPGLLPAASLICNFPLHFNLRRNFEVYRWKQSRVSFVARGQRWFVAFQFMQ